MKRILLAVVLCLVTKFGFAQADSIHVRNLTGCTVYFQIHAANTAVPCANNASSNFVALAAEGW